MAKPLRVTKEMKQSLLQEFVQYLNSGKLSDGRVDFQKNFYYKDGDAGKVRLHFEPKAWLKMTALIEGFNVDEVAWYGTVEHPEPDRFVITDVYTYPQTVGAAAVNTDQEVEGSEYTKWMNEIEPEIWNKQRFQGHSHVKMGVTPSATDLKHQRDLISQFTGEDDFYIFMIWNQNMQYDAKIYDMKTNTLYETKDVILTVCDPELDVDAFMAEAKKMVKIVTYTGGYNYRGSNYGGYGGYNGGYQYNQNQSYKGNAGSTTPRTDYNANLDEDDDYDNYGAQSQWQRKVYGDGKNPADKESKSEKKETGAAAGKAGGAGNVVDFGKVMA